MLRNGLGLMERWRTVARRRQWLTYASLGTGNVGIEICPLCCRSSLTLNLEQHSKKNAEMAGSYISHPPPSSSGKL